MSWHSLTICNNVITMTMSLTMSWQWHCHDIVHVMSLYRYMYNVMCTPVHWCSHNHANLSLYARKRQLVCVVGRVSPRAKLNGSRRAGMGMWQIWREPQTVRFGLSKLNNSTWQCHDCKYSSNTCMILHVCTKLLVTSRSNRNPQWPVGGPTGPPRPQGASRGPRPPGPRTRRS